MDEGEDPEWERHGRKRVSWTLEYPESDQTNLVVRCSDNREIAYRPGLHIRCEGRD